MHNNALNNEACAGSLLLLFKTFSIDVETNTNPGEAILIENYQLWLKFIVVATLLPD